MSSRGDRDGPLAVWSLGQGAEELDLPSTPEGLTGTLYRETPSEDVGEDARGHYPRWVGDELWFAGTGGASLPFAGLYHAREVTFTWRAKLGCTDAECGEQVMWQALQSLPFWLEMVAIPELEESPDASGGQVGLRSVWFEALLQRDPFVHTVATARVLLPTRGAQGEIPWIRFALSLAHGLPPVLRVAVEDTLEGKAAAQENTTRGTSGGCDYSAPMADTFIDECLQDVEIGRTQHAQECETAYPRLSEAVAECNRRQACSGVTFTPLGVFELRAGRVYPGQSGRSEISWVRQSCDSIMNVVPVERCLTGRASERRRFTCFRSGTGLPFQIGYASWCPPRGSFAPPAPPGEPALRRLAHHQAHTHRMLTGCSNDFWFLDESGVLGIWLGSRAGAASALKSLGRAEFFGALHDFRVWESYWDDEWEANWRRGELGRSGPAKMESDMRLDQCASPGEIDCVDADDGTYAGVEVEIEWPRMFSLVDDSEFHERGVLKVRVSGKGDASLRASPAEVVVSVNGATFFQETHSAAWRDGDGGGDGNTLVLQFAVRDAPSFESLATGRLPLGWSVIEARALDSAGKLLGDTASWFFTHHDRLEGGYWHPGQASQRCGEQGQCSTDATVQRSEKGWEDGCAEDLRAASDAAAAAAKGCKTPAPAQALAYAFWVLGVRSVLDIGSGGLEWLPWFPSALEEASDGEWRLGEKGPSEEHAPAVLEYLAVDPSPGVRQRLRAQPGVPGVKLRVEDGEAGDVRIDMRQTQSGQQTAGQVARDVGNDANEDAQQSAVPHLVVLRGLLPLLSLREAHDLYLRVARSGAQYLLVTSHPGIVANSDARHTFSVQSRPFACENRPCNT